MKVQFADSHLHLNPRLTLQNAFSNALTEIDRSNVLETLLITTPDDNWEFKEIASKAANQNKIHLIRYIDMSGNFQVIENQIREASELGALGIKFHPRIGKFNLEAPNFLQAMELANELKLLVILCTFWDGAWNRYQLETKHFANTADLFPSTNFIWAHAGGHKILDFMMMARRRENVYLDTSFTQHYFFSGNVFEDLLYSISSLNSRCLFGTDFEERDYYKMSEQMIIKYRQAIIDDTTLENFLSKNLRKLLAVYE